MTLLVKCKNCGVELLTATQMNTSGLQGIKESLMTIEFNQLLILYQSYYKKS